MKKMWMLIFLMGLKSIDASQIAHDSHFSTDDYADIPPDSSLPPHHTPSSSSIFDLSSDSHISNHSFSNLNIYISPHKNSFEKINVSSIILNKPIIDENRRTMDEAGNEFYSSWNAQALNRLESMCRQLFIQLHDSNLKKWSLEDMNLNLKNENEELKKELNKFREN
jgi:hypothetical protein